VDSQLESLDPWVARASVEAWDALRGTRAEEAMRLYVRLLDEDAPRWWDGGLEARKRTNAGMCAVRGVEEMPRGLREAVETPSVWRFLEYAGRRPSARFQHAASAAGEKMYVVGGSFRGRMMADTHELDLVDLTWRRLATPAGSERALPACAGHRAATVGETTYVVGGRYKGSSESEMAVYRMERMDVHEGVDEVEWIRVETTGEETPRARRGASVTAFGDRELVVFGGEDDEGRFMNDVWILDVDTLAWRAVKNPSGTVPEPRAEHTATTWGRETLLIFGGTGRSTKCYDSLYALDLTQGKWTTVTPKGVRPPPRAGHAGVLLRDGRFWALVGGGNNECGLMECSVLDLEETEWVSRTDAFVAPPVVGEGMTLCAVSTRDGLEDVIVAFGGYNGHCQNETQILRVAEDFPDHETPTTDARGDETDARGANEVNRHTLTDAESDSATEISESSTTRVVELDAKPATTFAFGTGASVEAYRNENIELRRSLHRLRTDAKLVADAHEHLRSKCAALERALEDEKRRAGELEDKVVALAEQLRDVPGTMGSFFHP
jgi:hypothetical protein